MISEATLVLDVGGSGTATLAAFGGRGKDSEGTPDCWSCFFGGGASEAAVALLLARRATDRRAAASSKVKQPPLQAIHTYVA